MHSVLWLFNRSGPLSDVYQHSSWTVRGNNEQTLTKEPCRVSMNSVSFLDFTPVFLLILWLTEVNRGSVFACTAITGRLLTNEQTLIETSRLFKLVKLSKTSNNLQVIKMILLFLIKKSVLKEQKKNEKEL